MGVIVFQEPMGGGGQEISGCRFFPCGQCSLGCPKDVLFGRSSWQVNMTWPVMPETCWSKMAVLLWATPPPPPGPQKISGPYIEVENSTLSYIVHRMLIRKLLTRKRDLSYSQYSNTNIAKNAEKQNSRICRPVSSECVQKHWRQNILPHLKSVWHAKNIRMSIRWALYDSFEVSTLLMIRPTDLFLGGGDQSWQSATHHFI